MQTPPTPLPSGQDTRRPRGTRAGLDLAQIVAAARSLDPRSLTMQAVADRLGVDRKALNHHVSDRDGLLRLVALTAFTSSFDAAEVGPGEDWRDALVIWARAVHDSVIATGAAVDYAHLDWETGRVASDRLEELLQTLMRAGFGAETAGRGLRMLASIAWSHARDVIISEGDNDHPQLVEMRRALGRGGEGTYPALRTAVEDIDFGYDDRQFEFQLRIFIQGMEAELLRSS